MFRSFMRRWADQTLRTELAELNERLADAQAELSAERRGHAVAQTELEAMAEVIARDRARVRAESSIAARTIAENTATKAGHA